MEQNVIKAVKLYSGDRPLGLFVDRLGSNLRKMNAVYQEIAELFAHSGISNFEKLPKEPAVCGKFAALFRELNEYLEAAKVQGFTWSQTLYQCQEDDGKSVAVEMTFDETIYLTLAQRYKELAESGSNTQTLDGDDVPYDLVSYLTEIDTGVIDAEYMNSCFKKYLKLRAQDGADEKRLEEVTTELHKSFASLTQEEQKFANIFLHDIERGDIVPQPDKTLRDYITEYQCRAKDDQIHRFATSIGVDEEKLRTMMALHLNEANINEFGRFDELKKTLDKIKAKTYLEKVEGQEVKLYRVNREVDNLLRKFITQGGFEVAKAEKE